MDELLKQLNKKWYELNELVKYAVEYLDTAPDGILRISNSHNKEQYYIKRNTEEAKKEYISKKTPDLIFALAQKDYIQKLLKQARKELKSLNQLLKVYEPEGIQSIYENLPLERKKLVKPYILPQDQFVEQWMNTMYEKKKIEIEDGSEIITERGEIVRSKSEKILADKLFKMEIPYHYEKPLYIKGFGNIYPDFTVLNKRTRREYYWEHLGLMDQADYCENAIKKIEAMQKSGVFLGERLILTFETSKHPINVKSVEGLIQKYLV